MPPDSRALAWCRRCSWFLNGLDNQVTVDTDISVQQAEWYVVQTKPKQEFRALEQLQNQNYDCFLPTLQINKIRRGKLVTDTEPLFSRYLFIRLDTVTVNWNPIRSTRGVSNLVAFGGRFATLPGTYIEALQSAPESLPPDLFEPGDQVTITDGPFAGWEGLYQLPDGEARAFVLIELMRQPQKLSFALETLRKTS
jgi:transcriptional antiterminator RfaH